MTARLAVLGVGEQAEALYRNILRMPRLELAAHRSRLGWTDAEGDAALLELRTQRLVRVGPGGELVTDHPRAALERLVSAEEARLATRRQDLARVRDSIDQFAADHRIGRELSSASAPDRERVDRAELVAVHEHLAASTVGAVRQAARTAPSQDVAGYPTLRHQVQEGRELRSLYASDVVERCATWRAAWAQTGEAARVSRTLPSDFVVFGTDVALGSTEWGRSDGDFVVLRDPMVVAAFVELFDRLWLASAALEPAADEPEGLLELMRQGLKDEAIARVLGISLRTVRRRVAALMAEHGVDTRFQLALRLAERRGRAD
ncbi:helix-turn-helix domain-containing protein [Allobranchiibius sp. GilTou38]|uniref:helix-turn-helix domain-containing protein n=1 Tax=Allobranchiibius sp. GilTou38 TaxID=2815210 RepID=UPI001AA1B9EB|nr:helix-turn-helix domain-containing protein [Allobranchiibius sp. GilTou38]MBO1767109.1 hypothetical protein [Allobranchiibius sp. GilTou38]